MVYEMENAVSKLIYFGIFPYLVDPVKNLKENICKVF